MDVDMTNGRFADVVINACVECGRLWLRYFVEYEAFTRSGRWARGIVDENTARTIQVEAATSFLESLPSYIRGGSYFGKAEVSAGRMHWN